MHALHSEILPPSGVEFAAWLQLTGENIVVARSNFLRIFELKAEKFCHIRTHRLHGIVTGLEGVKVLGDGRDRLLVSFKDAKIALLEWSPSMYDLITVSIHTYERAPQCLDIRPSFRSILRVDPLSRSAALLLPQDALAILPFTQNDVDSMEVVGDIPYSPSFILDLPTSVSSSIHNIIDFTFLPGFHNPTIAILFNERPTWTGRLQEVKDTCRVIIFSMAATFSIITTITDLPFDSQALVPCAVVGGLVVLTPNSIVYIDQASKRLVLPVNGWASRVSDLASPSSSENLLLEGSRATFISDTSLLIILTNGFIHTVTFAMDGKAVSGMTISLPLGRTTIPSLVYKLSELVFVASTQGPSVLLKMSMVDDVDLEMEDEPRMASVAEEHEEDVDMDADIYGPTSKKIAKREILTKTNARQKLVFSLSDYLPSYGGINDMVFGLTRNGDKIAPVLIASTSAGHLGGFTLFQRDLPIRTVKTKQRMHILGGQRGVWCFALASGNNKGTGDKITKVKPVAGVRGMIISTDANPSPGMSRIAIPSSNLTTSSSFADITILARTPGTTIGAGPFFGGTAVVQIVTGVSGGTGTGAATGVGGGAIRVLEYDGTERQVIKDVESSSSSSTNSKSTSTTTTTTTGTRPPIRACAISDPYILILREDDTMGLFVADAGKPDKGKAGKGDKDSGKGKEPPKGKVRRKDMSMLGGKTSRYLTGCFFTDHTGMLDEHLEVSPGAGIDLGSRSGNFNQWLMLVRPQGVLEIWTLPKLTLAFSVGAPFRTLENVLVDEDKDSVSEGTAVSHDISMEGASTMHENESQALPGSRDFDIEQVLVAPLGESNPEIHLFVLLRSGQLAIYHGISAYPSPSSTPDQKRLTHLRIAFIKVFSKTFEIQNLGSGNISSTGGAFSVGVGSSILAEHKRISRVFVPFRTTRKMEGSISSSTMQTQEREVQGEPGNTNTITTTYSGVFLTGENPSWILATDRGGVQLYPSGHAIVHAFSACQMGKGESQGAEEADPKENATECCGSEEFIVYSDEGPSLLEWIPDFQLDHPLPMRSIPRNRAYSSVVFDPSTSLVVAASVLTASFASFDEEGARIWEKDLPSISDPTTECSSLELISPDLWISMDGYEFATNEVVNSVACVTLETVSTETGTKEFIAVGTTVNRGEDLAAKGATYIFEIVEVVADPTLAPNRWYKLRLRCRDDAKGPVTALCGLNGYLVSSMGQKIFVRAFDSDERLVGVAFMDVGVYVTSLRTIKNLLLIGDAVKSVLFVAFQEDPYKLVLLAKDTRQISVTTADFFFSDNDMAIFTHDEEGIMRLYDYNPHDPESRDGRYLLLRSEFNSQAEYCTTALIARRTAADSVIPEAKLLCGATNGSIATITPVEEAAAKRLQLLQGQLTRNIQHIAGLNPRALRIVRNDYVSKPLSKGVLDANLLMHFESSSTPKQMEMTKQIGTEVGVVRRDWMVLNGPW